MLSHLLSTQVMALHNGRNCTLKVAGQGPVGAIALYMHELLHRSGKWGVNHITYIVVYSIMWSQI